MSLLDSLLPNLTDDEGFDTPEERVAQLKKRDTLKDAIHYGKAHLLFGEKGKWSTENLDRRTNEEVGKLYNIYMQQQTEFKDEMTGRAMGRQLINLM